MKNRYVHFTRSNGVVSEFKAALFEEHKDYVVVSHKGKTSVVPRKNVVRIENMK